MTITNTTVKQVFSGNGSTTQFTIPFSFENITNSLNQVVVYLIDNTIPSAPTQTLWTLNTQYTLTGGTSAQPLYVTTSGGYTVTSNQQLVITRVSEIEQTFSYANNSVFPAKSHENALDYLTMISQELNAQLSSFIALPLSSNLSNLTYPNPVAYGYLQWNGSANGVQNSVISANSPLVWTASTSTLGISQAGASSQGYLSSTDWNTFNNKQVAGSPAVSATVLGYISNLTSDVQAQINAIIAGTGSIQGVASSVNNQVVLFSGTTGKQSVAASGTGYGYLTAGVLSYVTTIPISQGGTNSGTALSNGLVMISSGGAIVESAVTTTTLGYLDATSSIQTQLNSKITGPLSSDVVTSGSVATIQAGVVTLAKQANLAANSIQGNNTGSPATPIALTATQVTAMLNNFTSSLAGLAPSSGGGTTNFLRADGSWAAPTAGSPSYSINPMNSNGTMAQGQMNVLTGTSSSFTATLPAVSASPGTPVLIARTDSTPSHIITIACIGSDTFQTGGTTLTINDQSSTATLIPYNGVWYIF
jgi:hypothetical protein